MPIPLEIALHEGFARICGPVKQWPRTWSVLMAAFIGVGSFLGGANGQTAAIPPIAAGAPTQANPAPIATGSEDWSLHVQTTVIEQWDYGFNSPYAGPNSFLPGPEEERDHQSLAGAVHFLLMTVAVEQVIKTTIGFQSAQIPRKWL